MPCNLRSEPQARGPNVLLSIRPDGPGAHMQYELPQLAALQMQPDVWDAMEC